MHRELRATTPSSMIPTSPLCTQLPVLASGRPGTTAQQRSPSDSPGSTSQGFGQRAFSAPVLAWQPSASEIHNRTVRLDRSQNREMREISLQNHRLGGADVRGAIYRNNEAGLSGTASPASTVSRSGEMSPGAIMFQAKCRLANNKSTLIKTKWPSPQWSQMLVTSMEERYKIAQAARSGCGCPGLTYRESAGEPNTNPPTSPWSPASAASRRSSRSGFFPESGLGTLSTTHSAFSADVSPAAKYDRFVSAAGTLPGGNRAKEDRDVIFLTR